MQSGCEIIMNESLFNKLENFKSREMIILECRLCQKEFTKPKYRFLDKLRNPNYSGPFCSQCCAYSFRKESKNNDYICFTCNIKFKRLKSHAKSTRVFCSHSCAAAYNNKIRLRILKEKVTRFCLNCNCSITKASNKKFCSITCRYDFQWKKTKQQIELNNGFIKENRGIARKYLIEKFGYKCDICHIQTWNSQPVPLVCDHIDGNSENNKLYNLRMICQNCNALLPTFGGRNRGKGRKYKRDKYHLDKKIWQEQRDSNPH